MKRTASIAASLIVMAAASLAAQAHPAAPATHPAPAAPKAGTIVRVRMTVTGGTHYAFEPANFSVKQGDIVEFVNVSGGPHNVSFEPTKVPAGAADILNRSMANRTSSLSGPMLQAVNQAYRVSFAGAPAGTYDYFCLPHKAMGMKGTITVTAAGAAAAPRR